MADFFHIRAIGGFLKKQTTMGTFVQPVETDAVFMEVTPDLDPTFETTDIDFVSGDINIPEGFSYTTDEFGDLKYTTPIFRLVEGLTPSVPITVEQAPHSAELEACGGTIVILADATWDLPNGSVICNNVKTTEISLSGDFRKNSVTDTVYQKSVQYKDLKGLVDLTLKPKEIPKFTFTLKGEVLNHGVPQTQPILHFEPPKAAFLPPIVTSTIQTSKIYPSVKVKSITAVTTTAQVLAEAHGFTTGDTVKITGINFVDADNDGNINEETNQDVILYSGLQTITVVDPDHFTYTLADTPSADASGNIIAFNITKGQPLCFESITANNLFGYELQRIISACTSGFSRGKVTSEVMCTIVENQVNGLIDGTSVDLTKNFDPDINRGNTFAVELKFGSDAGKYFTVLWDFLRIKEVKKGGDVGVYTSRDITFRNDRHVYLIWN